ncbi:hypothetical protein EUX98_g6955 [Antrodiella citrinella]|uniref:Uncharacterized protein n=1 Tax=Antrodiella citrinella TaxID=2447956 RepID=A0A4S4MPH2_9APHY|nr:hypothetical protein EUX98_g6955 [Antrodiella citrinella]
MVMPVADALVIVDQEQAMSQRGTPAPSSSHRTVSPSNALAVPARRVDISKDFQNLLSQLQEEEEEEEEELMDVDSQSSDALAHTQVICSQCRDFGHLVACTAPGCTTRICYRREQSEALPCVDEGSMKCVFAQFKCPPCHRKWGTEVDYKLNHPPNLSLVETQVPLLLVGVLGVDASDYMEQMADLHFRTLFGTSEECVSVQDCLQTVTIVVLKYTEQYHFMKIRLSLERVTLKENLREMAEGKSWQKEHPTARVMVLMSSHSNMDDGTIAWGRQKSKSKQYVSVSSPLSSVLDKFLGDLLPRNEPSRRAIFVLMSCGMALTVPEAAANFKQLARERFHCAVGFTASTIVSNQVFVHILPFLNALAMGVKVRRASQASLFNSELLRQSAVVFAFRDVKDVLQVQYIFYVVMNYHVQPLGLDLLCPKCGEHLLGKNEQNGKHSHRWRFRCQKCKQQTQWLTLKDLHHTGPHESAHWYSQYPPPSNYKDVIMNAAWTAISNSV